jgi:PAS domain S-box-containing protein
MDVASSPFSDPVASFASESEHQLRFITDALPALVSYVDTNERYTYVNNSYCKWFGQSRENIIGKHIREIVGEDAYASLAPYVYKVLSGKEVSFEALMPYATAGMRYVSASYTPQFDNDGKVKGFVVLAIDISQQKSVEEELRQNQQELSDFLENSPVGIQWFDASGKII